MSACAIIAINSEAIFYGLAGLSVLFLAALVLVVATR